MSKIFSTCKTYPSFFQRRINSILMLMHLIYMNPPILKKTSQIKTQVSTTFILL